MYIYIYPINSPHIQLRPISLNPSLRCCRSYAAGPAGEDQRWTGHPQAWACWCLVQAGAPTRYPLDVNGNLNGNTMDDLSI